MTGDPGERLFRALLRVYPRAFRDRYGDDVLAFFREDRRHPKYGSGVLRPVRFWSATLRDLARTTWRARVPGARSSGEASLGTAGAGRRLSADLRDGWRSLRLAPGVTAAALVVLTLAIGAGTAIFSVVDAVVLRGLPFADASRLVSVAETYLPSGSRPGTVAWPNYVDWRLRQDVFSTMGASAHAGQITTVGDGPAERLRVVRMTASLFDVLQVSPALGRRFTHRDEEPGAPRGAILTDGLWRRRFGGRRDVIGQTMAVEGGVIEIIGVMPAGFMYPVGSMQFRPDLWMSFPASAMNTSRTGGRNYLLTVVGRLGPGISIEQASGRMTQIRSVMEIEHPRWFVDHGIAVIPLHTAIVGSEVPRWMWLLLVAVGLVLAIACLNVANLLVARAVARAPEIALRAALGASRGAIARGLLVESLVLSLVGTALGTLAAFGGVSVLRAALPQDLPRLAGIAVDLRVLVVAAVAGVVTGLLFGILPALQFARPDIARVLQSSGRANSGASASQRLRMSLVVAEVALAVMLLAGAGLFLSSFLRVMSVDLGLDTRQVASFGVGAPRPTPPAQFDKTASQQLVISAMAQVQAVPGVVAAAALGGGLPLSGGSISVPVQLPGRDAPPFKDNDEPYVHSVSVGYLDVVRGTMLRGRWIADTDVAAAPQVVVISDEAARRYFGDEDPLGRTLLMETSPPRTIVGVIRGMRHGGPEAPVRPEVFVPYLQGDQPGGEIVFRHDGRTDVIARVREAIRTAAPALIVADPQTMDGHFATLIARRKFNMIVLGLFGGLAVVIAAAGVYGLMAFLVAQRTREIGVRLALGARPNAVLGQVLRGASVLVGTGLVVGLAGALALERFVRGFLFVAPSYDPALYAAVAGVLLAAGIAAALGPARRAARVDPVVALRSEGSGLGV